MNQIKNKGASNWAQFKMNVSQGLLTVALNIFRITLALIFDTPVQKVSKPHLGSISSSNWYEQRVDKVKNDYQHANLISFPVHFRWNVHPKKKFRKIFIAPKVSSWNFRGCLLSYFWAITFISAVIAILDPFGTLVPRFSATVNSSHVEKLKITNDRMI